MNSPSCLFNNLFTSYNIDSLSQICRVRVPATLKVIDRGIIVNIRGYALNARWAAESKRLLLTPL